MHSNNTKADRWNLKEYPEIKTHNWDQLIFYKDVKKIHQKNDILFSNGAGKTEYLNVKERNKIYIFLHGQKSVQNRSKTLLQDSKL